MNRSRHREGRSHFVLGIILLCLGAVLLALNLGFAVPWHLWRYFPIPMIAFGLWGILSPSRDLDRIGGLWLLTNGLYCLISVFNLFGLSWGTAWPLYIITAGIAVIGRHEGIFCGRSTGNKDAAQPPAQTSGDQ